MGHELSSAIAGGLSPVVATALPAATGHFLPVALLTMGMALVTLVALLLFAQGPKASDPHASCGAHRSRNEHIETPVS
ncbi:hypothetical protein [Streptomyces sp. 351MFTsu5.1]|uniref:hypothetical protein n=1 Tax=Streptomyces sp. 351MFTsu5.1 TaxID=1172180 RepID=UPI000374341E|nr:hypothetical protein [Streptomyces sp. 351MFTsu5.1]